MIVGYYLSDGQTTSDDAWCVKHVPPGAAAQFKVPIDDMGGEADTPTHCVTCETLLAHPLTPDGLDYVWEAVTEALLHDSGRICIVAQWWAEYGDLVKDKIFGDNTEAVTELALTHVDFVMHYAPLRDDYSPDANYLPGGALHTTVHLLKTRGGTECGGRGYTDPDIRNVTCPSCLTRHAMLTAELPS
jgi:hypothetical protein